MKDTNIEGDSCRQCDQLEAEVVRYRSDAHKYHEVMQALKRSKMQHGLCEPIERHACTACAALRKLESMVSDYKGPRVVLA